MRELVWLKLYYKDSNIYLLQSLLNKKFSIISQLRINKLSEPNLQISDQKDKKQNKFYKQILYQRNHKFIMRAQNRKIIQNVMKSPSPDIAHRSVIVNTKSPVNQIKQYIRMRQSSTSPKSLNTSFHHISKGLPSQNQQLTRLKRYLHELQQKIGYLEKIKVSHEQLLIINQNLNHQISQLKLQIRNQKQKNIPNSQRNISPNNLRTHSPKANNSKGVSLIKNSQLNTNPQFTNASQSTQNDSILRQFNERMIRMSQQNKRLGKRLKQIKDEKDQLQKQNNVLKTHPSYQHTSYQNPSFYDNQNLKRYFNEQAQKIINEYEQKSQSKLLKLERKIIQLQNQLQKIYSRESQVKNKQNKQNEIKKNGLMDTNYRSQNQQEGPFCCLAINKQGMVQSKYTTSPSEFKTSPIQASPIRQLQQQKDKVRKQNDFLIRKAKGLEEQVKNLLLLNDNLKRRNRQLEEQTNTQNNKSPNEDINFGEYRQIKEKNEYLESQLKKRYSQIEIRDIKIRQYGERLNKMEKYSEERVRDYEKNIQQLKNNIQQLKNKLNQYVELVNECQKSINQYQLNYIHKSKYQLLSKQLQLTSNQLNKLKQQLKQINLKYQSLNYPKYLSMVKSIRYSITGQQLQNCIQSIQSKLTVQQLLQIQIIQIHQSYQAIVLNLKKKILDQSLTISHLQRQNSQLHHKVQQCNIQIQKLQRAINEYKEPTRVIISQQELSKKINIHKQNLKFNHRQSDNNQYGNSQSRNIINNNNMRNNESNSRNSQTCKIRQYINRTVSKIGQLQTQIQWAIKQNQTNKKQLTEKQSIEKIHGHYRQTGIYDRQTGNYGTSYFQKSNDKYFQKSNDKLSQLQKWNGDHKYDNKKQNKNESINGKQYKIKRNINENEFQVQDQKIQIPGLK